MRNAEANPRPLHLRLKGLDPKAVYILEEQQISSGSEYPVMKQRSFTGAALMYAGTTLPALLGDYPSALLYFKRQERA
jgi:alpha-galactosidase